MPLYCTFGSWFEDRTNVELGIWFHILPKSGIWLQKWLLPFNPLMEPCRGGKHIIIILALKCTLHVVRLIFFQLTSSCPIALPKIKLDAPVDRARSHQLPSLSQWQGSSLSGCTSAFGPQKHQQRPVSWKEASWFSASGKGTIVT
jgi:hypothetical protein